MREPPQERAEENPSGKKRNSRISNLKDRKVTEKALPGSEEAFKALAENAGDGILIGVAGGIHVYANRRAGEITGYSVAELLKTSIKDLAAPDEVKKLIERFRKRLSGEAVPHQYETIIIRKDGKTVPIEFSAAKTSWHGQPADLVIFRDITERKRMEDTLRESERELKALFKSMINAFVLFDSVFDDDDNFVSCRFVYINDAYERITGVKNDEIQGKTMHEVWPNTEASWIKAYGDVAVTGVPSSFEMYHEPTKKLYYCNVYRQG